MIHYCMLVVPKLLAGVIASGLTKQFNFSEKFMKIENTNAKKTLRTHYLASILLLGQMWAACILEIFK